MKTGTVPNFMASSVCYVCMCVYERESKKLKALLLVFVLL